MTERFGLIKNIYDSIKDSTNFDLNLFVNIVYKYNLHSDVFQNVDENVLSNNGENLKIFFEYKDIKISSIDDIVNIEQTIFNNFDKKINSTNKTIDLKNVICNMLFNQTYLETKKGILETGSVEKLITLKNSIENASLNKEIDSYIIISQFFDKIDKLEDISELQSIANSLNKEILNNGFKDKWLNLNDKIMNLYNHEINHRMTNFEEHMTSKFFDATDYTFDDGTNVQGKRVKVAHIKTGEEYNAFIHVLNAYQNASTTGNIESLINPKFIGQAYMCLTGISDEYSRICINNDSKYSIKVLYSHIPNGNLFCASNRDTGIHACENSKNVYTRLPKNMMPFRRLVRNTEVHGSETYNEYDVYRDGLVPSGIAFMNAQPTQEEINAAAYLGVPLVQIDDLQESFRKDSFSLNRGGLYYDENFYHIKEHSYEDTPVQVSPNDHFDQMMMNITNQIENTLQKVQINPIEVTTIKDETGSEEYISSTTNGQYSATPLYDYIDSSRCNVDVANYEKAFIKMKLYDLFGTPSKLKCAYGKYPNGKIALSIFEEQKEPNEIDKCIEFLTDYRYDEEILELDFDFLTIETQNKIKILAKIKDDEYLKLFENLIAVNNYTEPKQFMQTILDRKYKIQELAININRQTLMTNEEVSTQSLGKQVLSKIANTSLEDEYEQIIDAQEKAKQDIKDNISPNI